MRLHFRLLQQRFRHLNNFVQLSLKVIHTRFLLFNHKVPLLTKQLRIIIELIRGRQTIILRISNRLSHLSAHLFLRIQRRNNLRRPSGIHLHPGLSSNVIWGNVFFSDLIVHMFGDFYLSSVFDLRCLRFV